MHKNLVTKYMHAVYIYLVFYFPALCICVKFRAIYGHHTLVLHINCTSVAELEADTGQFQLVAARHVSDPSVFCSSPDSAMTHDKQAL